MEVIALCSITLLMTFIKYSSAVESSTQSVSVVNKLLQSYDKDVRPNADQGNATTVSLDFFINSISEINEISMDYNLNLFFRQRWRDPRLDFSALHNHSILVSPDKLARVWIPDIFFKNEKSGRLNNIMTANTLFKLSPNGDILLSQRVSLRLACPMDLYKFPLDNQTCGMEIESYSFTTRDIVLKWHENPVQWDDKKSIILPDFSFVAAETSDCTTGYVTGSFACLRVTYSIQRKLGYYLSQLFIPSILIVILSWVSFWIDVNATPARVSLGLLTVLTMTTQSARFPTPRVSYVKALDIWSSLCLVFVFGGLLEFAIVNVMARIDKLDAEEKKSGKTNGAKNGVSLVNFNIETEKSTANEKTNNSAHVPDTEYRTEKDLPTINSKRRGRSKAEQVDYISRFLFPSLFIAFNITYWVMYIVVLQ